MGTEEILRYVMSLIGGGLVVAILNWVKEARSATRQRAVAYLHDQLRLLYGPLHCLTAQNMETLKRTQKLQDALDQKIKVGPQEQEIPPARGAEAEGVIGLSNAYSTDFKKNNVRIRQLLEANWSLIDMEDVEPFLAFLADCARMQIEVEEKHGEGVWLRVHHHLGAIYYVRPDFVERVTTQWNAKRERLGQLLMPRWWHWPRGRGSRNAA